MASTIKGEKIWMDGELVDWEKANVHILTHTLHYGLGVFEGIRLYKTTDGRSAIFRNYDHMKRLLNSAKIVQLNVKYSVEELMEANKTVVNSKKIGVPIE
jgi:branched-chain amino acid aminotransferase